MTPEYQCCGCKHVLPTGCHCRAFRQGASEGEIPGDIMLGLADHRLPYPGDNGIRWEPAGPEPWRRHIFGPRPLTPEQCKRRLDKLEKFAVYP